jgi:hypothetical protein
LLGELPRPRFVRLPWSLFGEMKQPWLVAGASIHEV